MGGMIFQIILSLFILALAADRFVKCAIDLSLRMQWSPLLIGSILVGFATTFPEMLVSLIAVQKHHVGISLGNALGSYVANIGLVLGCIACIRELKVDAALFKRELPILTFSVLLTVTLLLDQFLGYWDGIILLITLGVLMIGLIKTIRSEKTSKIYSKLEVNSTILHSLQYDLMMFVLSLSGLVLSAHFLIEAAAQLAHYFGVSDLVIGLTVVAIGTSLPELVTSLMCMKHGQDDMALGNVIGSNVLGVLGVIAIPALLSPGPVDFSVIWRDCVAMLFMTLALWVFIYNDISKASMIKRWEGAVLLMLFMIYIGVTIIATPNVTTLS